MWPYSSDRIDNLWLTFGYGFAEVGNVVVCINGCSSELRRPGRQLTNIKLQEEGKPDIRDYISGGFESQEILRPGKLFHFLREGKLLISGIYGQPDEAMKNYLTWRDAAIPPYSLYITYYSSYILCRRIK